MSKEEQYVEELVGVSNVFEVIQQAIDKVGLEYMAPIEPSRRDEIISKEILAVVRG